MFSDKSQRTETPTPRKRRKARRKGHVPRSREISSTIVLAGSMLFIILAGSTGISRFAILMHASFTMPGRSVPGNMQLNAYIHNVYQDILVLLIPFLIYLLGLGIIGNILLGGVVFSTERLKLRSDHLHIFPNFSRIFLSKRSFIELLKNIIKLSLVFYISYSTIKDSIPGIMLVTNFTILGISTFFFKIICRLLFRILILMGILSIIDYYLEKKLYESDLKMTKQEVKDDLKQSELNPVVRNRIRTIHRQSVNASNSIKDADLVITDPEQLVVALKYNRNIHNAPVVIKKGKKLTCENIKNIATDHSIPVVENPALARTIYQQVKLGNEIPGKLYRPIAEILGDSNMFKTENNSKE